MSSDTPMLDYLEEIPHARKRDPRTSHRAASDHIRIGSIRHAILYHLLLAGHNGLTTWELAREMGIRRDSVSPNMKPLERMGLVCIDGTERGERGKHLPSLVYMTAPKANSRRVQILRDRPYKYMTRARCPHCGGKL